jgi:hypothetical protein
MAPGAYPDTTWRDPHSGSALSSWRGASIAAGYVAGAAALLLERRPATHARQLLGELLGTATPDSMIGVARGRLRLLYVGTDR